MSKLSLATASVTPQAASRRRFSQARSAVRAHTRAEVASACRACGEHVHAQRSTRRYCSSPCRQRAYRAGRKPILVPVAHQHRIREREAALDPRPAMTTLEGCTVERIPFAEAKTIILRHEWLGTMPPGARACYRLKTSDGELAGVAVFAPPPSPESRDLCGPEYRDQTISLSRGACVHWAHPQGGSFLIAKACKLAAKEFGWRIFCAYADPTAGEIGTVYQAANWLYLGAGVGRSGGLGRWRFFSRREGRWSAEREIRAMGQTLADVRREKRNLARALKYPPLPFPKR
jgi:hypothetical protein